MNTEKLAAKPSLAIRIINRGRRTVRKTFAPLARWLYRTFPGFRASYWNSRAKDLRQKWDDADGDFPLHESIVRRLGARSVLDWGCGSGRLNRVLFRLPLERITGHDIAEDACVHCRRKYQDPRYTVQSGPLSQIRDAFDLIISCYTFFHIPSGDAPATAAELCRIGKAILIIETPQGERNDDVFYLHRHNYDELLGVHKFREVDSGVIRKFDQEGKIVAEDRWRLFCPAA